MSEISNITPTVSTFRNHVANATGDSNQTTVNAVDAAKVSSLNSGASASASEKRPQLSAEGVKAAADIGNRVLQATSKNLQFQVDEATKQVVVKIVDSKTGEVVRQIPTVEMLDFIRAMKEQESNTGKLYSSKA